MLQKLMFIKQRFMQVPAKNIKKKPIRKKVCISKKVWIKKIYHINQFIFQQRSNQIEISL